MHLDIILPQNRYFAGFFVLRDHHGHLIYAGRARGKADNGRAMRADNPSRDSRLPYGDTPLGEYHETRLTLTHNISLGDAWFPIEGRSGDALTAVENGRFGIGIHAGRSNVDGALVTTYGCVRVDRVDFKRLADLVGDEMVSVRISERYGS